jgi:hypothetical protein
LYCLAEKKDMDSVVIGQMFKDTYHIGVNLWSHNEVGAVNFLASTAHHTPTSYIDVSWINVGFSSD